MDIISYFFPTDQPITVTVNVAILTVTGIALWTLYRAWAIELRAEQQALGLLRDGSTSRKEPEQLKEIVPTLPEASMARVRLQDLVELWEEGDDIRPELLTDLSAGVLENRAVFARWATGSVLLLGLGGTVAGLARAVTSAEGLLNLTTIEQPIDNVLAVFSGLNVAFATTLAGIISAIILGLLTSGLRRRENDFVHDLEHLLTVRLAPRFQTSVSRSLATAAQKLRAIEKDLDGALRDVIDQLHTRGMALTSTIDRSMTDLKEEWRDTSKELLGRIEQNANALVDRYDKSWAAMRRLVGDPADDAVTIADGVKSLGESVDGLRAAVESTERLVPALQESLAREIDKQTRDLNEAMNAYTGRLNEGADRNHETIQEGLGRLEALTDRVDKELRAHLDRQSALLKSAIADGMTERVGGVEQGIDGLNGAAAQLARAAAEVKDTLEHYVTLMAEIISRARSATPSDGAGAAVPPPGTENPAPPAIPELSDEGIGPGSDGNSSESDGKGETPPPPPKLSWIKKYFGRRDKS